MAKGNDTDVREAGATESPSLYSKVVEVTGIEYDAEQYDDVDEYKATLARKFNDMPEADFEKLEDDVEEFANELIKTVKDNRGARRKKALPKLTGLAEDSETAEKKSGRGRGAKAKAEKEPKEPAGRDPTANRNYRVAQQLIKTPTADAEAVQKALTKAGHEYSLVTVERAVVAYQGVYGALKDAGKIAAD